MKEATGVEFYCAVWGFISPLSLSFLTVLASGDEVDSQSDE